MILRFFKIHKQWTLKVTTFKSVSLLVLEQCIPPVFQTILGSKNLQITTILGHKSFQHKNTITKFGIFYWKFSTWILRVPRSRLHLTLFIYTASKKSSHPY